MAWPSFHIHVNEYKAFQHLEEKKVKDYLFFMEFIRTQQGLLNPTDFSLTFLL